MTMVGEDGKFQNNNYVYLINYVALYQMTVTGMV